MRMDPKKALRALAIGAWAAFFDWLWLSGAAASYAAPRTTWVVTFGAIALTIAFVAMLVNARTATPGPVPTWREAGAMGALVAPVLAVVLVPAPSLGSFAVDQKGSSAIVATAEVAKERKDDPLTLYDVNAASESSDYAEARGMHEGERVTIEGLVSEAGADGSFELARFDANCCAADAIPYVAKVLSAESDQYAVDTWLRAEGELEKLEDETWGVRASAITQIDEPNNPYGK